MRGQGPTGTGRCSWLPVSEGPHGPGAGGPGQGGAPGWGSGGSGRQMETVANGPLSPGAPWPWALQAPWGLHCGGPRCRVHRQGFPPAMCTSSIRGKCSEEPRGPQGSEEGDIGRVQPTLDFPRPPTLPAPWREMRVLLALGQRPCWMKPGSCSSLQPEVLPAAPRWSSGRRTDGQVPLHSSSLLLLRDWGLWPGGEPSGGESPRDRGTGSCGWWFTGGTFSEAPSLCSSSPLSRQACPLSPP